MKLIRHIVFFFQVLLFALSGESVAFASVGSCQKVEFHTHHSEVALQQTNLAFAARAPPYVAVNVATAGTLFHGNGDVRALSGAKGTGVAFAFLQSSIAPNRTVTDFVDGVTVTDIRTGRTISGTVDLRPTLDRIENGGSFPHGRDGSVFQNRPLAGRAQPELPTQAQGYYTEYVHPTPGISGPGPQRIVTGAGGEIYYTPDHYSTFIRLDQ